MSHLPANETAQSLKFPSQATFEVLEGQLRALIEGETLILLQGDVVFIPGNATYKYYSTLAFTKVLYISQGAGGLDTALIASAKSWDSPVWPTAY
jgi:glyoxylate utilization-related uncharacterized protein